MYIYNKSFQCWQQLELLNEDVFNDETSKSSEFNKCSLNTKVNSLIFLAENNPTSGLLPNLSNKSAVTTDNEDNTDESGDEGLGSVEDDELEDEEENEDNESEDEMNNENNKTDDSLVVDDSDDSFSEGDFNDIALEDDEDESDSDENDENNYSNDEMDISIGQESKLSKSKDSIPTFSSTSVDSQFLRLRESEWVADNDLIGECQDFDDIDLMEDISDSNDQENFMFKDFFDPPPSEKSDGNNLKKKEVSIINNDTNVDTKKSKETLNDEVDSEPEVTPLLGGTKKQVKSLYEKMMEQDEKQFEHLEEINVGDKEWVMKGEVLSENRPENSLLEENLEYTIAASQRPVTTEETTNKIEKFIIGIVRNGVFDDVERKERPLQDPTEYKKKLLLDQTKNQKSLAEIYEEEYIKQQNVDKEEKDQEIEEHKEIRLCMDKLFSKLDALSNYHYTPRQKMAELKIVSNLPALSMEDAAPVSMSDAAMLAPQEVIASTKGDLQGKSEQTTTDKKRQRRKKKIFQKLKSEAEEQKTKKKIEKLKKKGKTLDVKTSAKVVDKAIKRGHVKLVSIIIFFKINLFHASI